MRACGAKSFRVTSSQPVALLIDEKREIEDVVSSMRYRYFRDPENFHKYVRSEILGVEDLAA